MINKFCYPVLKDPPFSTKYPQRGATIEISRKLVENLNFHLKPISSDNNQLGELL